MSMDLAVWADTAIQIPAQVPNSSAWQKHDDEWAYEGKGWQVTLLSSDEDKPDSEVLAKVPRARTVIYVTLEPIGAGPEAYEFLERVVRTLANSVGGVWVTPDGTAYYGNEGEFR